MKDAVVKYISTPGPSERREIRIIIDLRDLEEIQQKRPILGKTAYELSVKTLVRSQRAQTMAKRFAKKLRSTCLQVIKNNGAAASN